MITLTSKQLRSDGEMRVALGRLLSWLRECWRGWDGWYLWVAELHQRGVLHFHLLISERIPRPLFLRLRALWADGYGMGERSVHILHMRSGLGAAKYLSKYLGKRPSHYRPDLDAEGQLVFTPWPVSRHNGEPYVRDRFRGNPVGMSKIARAGTVPVVDFWAEVGAFPGLDGWHGVSRFFESAEDAVEHLAGVLAAGRAPPPPV